MTVKLGDGNAGEWQAVGRLFEVMYYLGDPVGVFYLREREDVFEQLLDALEERLAKRAELNG